MNPNPLFQQWTLVGVIFAGTIACLSTLWVLFQLKAEQTRNAVVQIEAALSRLFHEAVTTEAVRIFEFVEDRLPTVLSQNDTDQPVTSPFDRLCFHLRQVNPEDPNRSQFEEILKQQLLSQIISREAKRVIQTSPQQGFSFTFDMQRKLAFLARKSTEAQNQESRYKQTRDWAFRLMCIAAICAVTVLLGALFSGRWAYFVTMLGLLVWGVAVTSYIITFVLQLRCHNWLLDASKKNEIPSQWQAEIQNNH